MSTYLLDYSILSPCFPKTSLFTVPFLTKLNRIRGPSLSTSHRHIEVQSRAFSMAWRSSGETNEALITNLVNNKLIGSERVRDAMLRVGLDVSKTTTSSGIITVDRLTARTTPQHHLTKILHSL